MENKAILLLKKYLFINEYDITIINYEDFYYCNDCNLDTEKKFKINTETYNGSPIISYSYVDKETYSNFCLYPTSNISVFCVGESKINQKFYTGKIVENAQIMKLIILILILLL